MYTEKFILIISEFVRRNWWHTVSVSVSWLTCMCKLTWFGFVLVDLFSLGIIWVLLELQNPSRPSVTRVTNGCWGVHLPDNMIKEYLISLHGIFYTQHQQALYACCNENVYKTLMSLSKSLNSNFELQSVIHLLCCFTMQEYSTHVEINDVYR